MVLCLKLGRDVSLCCYYQEVEVLSNKQFNIGRTMGLEPTNGGTTNHCLNHLATPATDNRLNIITSIDDYLNLVCQKILKILE